MVHWLSNIQRVVFVFVLFLLSMLALRAVPSLASEIRVASLSRSSNLLAVWDEGVTIADFDGDRLPDLAIVKETGSNPQASQYRVELHLTTRTRPSFFSVSAERGGLRMIPRDLDGDRDLDLILINAWSRVPVAVWINDSHGEFTPADPQAYPRSMWAETPENVSNGPQHIFQAALAQPSRSFIAAPDLHSLNANLVSDPLPGVTPAILPRAAIELVHTRAPPPRSIDACE